MAKSVKEDYVGYDNLMGLVTQKYVEPVNCDIGNPLHYNQFVTCKTFLMVNRQRKAWSHQ